MHKFKLSEKTMDKTNKLILYKDDEGRISVNVRFADEDVWLTQAQLAMIYDTIQENISMHISGIYKDAELDVNRTYKKFLLVRQEGTRQVKRNIDHYNLDMIIALGYRVQSPVAVRFRRWATQRLHEYIQKGFTLDDERLKQGGNRYFKELLQRIRDIRSSERNFYQQVTDIYATSTDYDPRSSMTKQFFSTVQNKMHYAVHEHTAAELIYERVDNEKPFVGMTNFKGNYVTRDDRQELSDRIGTATAEPAHLPIPRLCGVSSFGAEPHDHGRLDRGTRRPNPTSSEKHSGRQRYNFAPGCDRKGGT